MMEDIKAKKIDCVICKDLSRFAEATSMRAVFGKFFHSWAYFIAINDSYVPAVKRRSLMR